MIFSQNVKKWWWFFIIWLLLWIIWTFFLMQHFSLPHRENRESKQEINSFTGEISYDIFSSNKIKKIYDLIEDHYFAFHKKTNKEIESEFAEALVKSLGDKHSTYFDEKMTEIFNEDLRWDFEWIWAVVSPDTKWVKITHILDTSPAQKSGLKAGDIMTHVDGESIAGLTVGEAVEKIRWPKGTSIILDYLRGEKWNQKTDTTTVTRDIVKIPSIQSEMLTGSIGYIKVSTFWDKTSQDFYNAFNTLVESGSQAMILDFRYNWGGYLKTAIELSSAFLKENIPVVKIKENDPTKNEILYTVNWWKSNIHIPIIILINNYSASASEIFAWALQYYKRALIIWEQSYGKWSAQEIYSLWDGTVIKLTTARWYTPWDVSIDEKWITPDKSVYITDFDYQEWFDRQLDAAQKILENWLKDTKNSYESILKYAKDTNFQK